MFVRSELKDRAKAVLKKHYWTLLPLSILLVIIEGRMVSVQMSMDTDSNMVFQLQILNRVFSIPEVTPTLALLVAISGIVFLVATVFALNVLRYGLMNGFRAASEERLDTFDVLCGFRQQYWHVVAVQFRKGLSIFLWSFVFLIPGIIKSYEYCMVEYILYDHPEWSVEETLAYSRMMTMGKKWDIFVLDLSFILWYLLFGFLDLFTLGLASLLLNPYILQTGAELYLEIRPDEENTSDESDVYDF